MEDEKAASRDDEIVAVTMTAVSRLGDVWILGRHRLVCGDARDPAVLTSLLGDESADMVFTDPPYNVPIEGHVMGNGRVKHPEFAMASGEMSSPEFTGFLRQALDAAKSVSRDGALHYVWHGLAPHRRTDRSGQARLF